jgi:hypothetical protein
MLVAEFANVVRRNQGTNRWELPDPAVLLLDLDDDDHCEENWIDRRVGLGKADMMV